MRGLDSASLEAQSVIGELLLDELSARLADTFDGAKILHRTSRQIGDVFDPRICEGSSDASTALALRRTEASVVDAEEPADLAIIGLIGGCLSRLDRPCLDRVVFMGRDVRELSLEQQLVIDRSDADPEFGLADQGRQRAQECVEAFSWADAFCRHREGDSVIHVSPFVAGKVRAI